MAVEMHEMLTMDEAAEMAGVSRRTIDRWCQLGVLAYVQPAPGSPRRVRTVDLLALFEPKTAA